MHWQIRAAALVVALSTLVGCTTDPLNGTAFSTDVKGTSFKMGGYYNKPSVTIELFVLKTPASDPNQPANWASLGTTVSSTTALYWHSTDPLYSWSKTVTPVSAGAVAPETLRWPAGKLARLKAVAHDASGDQTLPIFDQATFNNCFGDHIAQSWSDIGLACMSNLGPLAVVSTTNNPSANDYDYLGTVNNAHPDLTDPQISAYYTAIGAPKTLTEWLNKYGFPTGEVVTAYYNEADLGFGRQMHCRKYGAGVACYVKNTATTVTLPDGGLQGAGAYPADPTTALGLATDLSTHLEFATVAMVYTPPDGPDAVKFFVYDATGKRTNTAQLDATNKHHAVPSNCLTCHGINASVKVSDAGVPSVTGAKFLPFDQYSFTFSTASGFTQAAQSDKFSDLNALVALTPMTAATSGLLAGMYGAVPTFGTPLVPNNRYIPPDWDTSNTDRTMYEGVVKPYCRGCHLTAISPTLNSPSDLSIACDASHVMPHAQQTFRRFWNGGARAYLSARYGLQATGDCSQ